MKSHQYIGINYAPLTDEETLKQEKLQTRNTRSQEKPTHDTNEGRRSSLEYFEEIRITREYARDILGLTKAQARKYAAENVER